MKSLVTRCQLCGNENLFPLKYAGRMLSCSHCGEALRVASTDATPVSTVPAARSAEHAAQESGLRRLNKAIVHVCCLLCIAVLGILGGGWVGYIAAFRMGGFLGGLFAIVLCPLGGFIGLWLARWIGQGLARLMSSYRLAFPGLLAGIAGGYFYWSQSVEMPHARLLSGQLLWTEWLTLSFAVAAGGLIAGLFTMIVDAFVNFTR